MAEITTSDAGQANTGMATLQVPRPRSRQELQASLPASLQRSLYHAGELARRRQGELREERLPTMVTALDELLGGGLPRGTLVELVGRGSCGRFAMLLGALQAVTDIGEVAALVDLGGQLDVQAAATAGVQLERLLWLGPQRLPEALSAAEMLVHTGFPLVAIDLGLPPVRGRVPAAAWLRLVRSAKTHRTAVLVSAPYRVSGCAATIVVFASARRGAWSGTGDSPRLLHGVATRLSTGRRRGHRPGEISHTTLQLAEAVSAPASQTRPNTYVRPTPTRSYNPSERSVEVQHAQAI
jgi:hypothetical protein